MSDTAYPTLQHYGTAAQRAAFTPSPAAGTQPIYIWYETDTGLTYLYHTAWVAISGGGSVTTPVPSGRLTLTTAVPYLVSSVTAATTIYYSPAVGNMVPLYNGTSFVPTSFSEVSQTTTDNTKSPAAVANNSNYDMFVWSDSGTIRCTRGPAWTSDTARGAGAGTTELVRTNGILLNNVSITNGPAASRGTYVGTVRSNGSAQIDFIVGGAGGAGGEGTILGIWNYYNQRYIALVNFDNTNSWTYTTLTWRLKNAGASTELNKIKFICGFQMNGISAQNYALSSNTNASVANQVAIGLDSTSVIAIGSSTSRNFNPTAAATFGHSATYSGMMPLGFHYLAPLEESAATGTTTWLGDNGGTDFYSLFNAQTMF